ncbi:MAG: RHS repeat domain-containing protein, partial [Plesiomonas shigelloides]
YRYDPFGRRISKRCEQTGEEIHYLWDGDQIAEVRHWQQGQLRSRRHWVWRGWELLVQQCQWININPHILPQTPAVYVEQGLHAAASEWQTDFAVSQQNGTVQGLYNPQGKLSWQAGKNTLWGLPQRLDSTPIDPGLAFAGQLRDEESGLCYNRFRYYDPQAASYISPDPIGILGGENSYSYVYNPICGVDPLGLTGKKCMGVSESGHHVPAVRKSKGRLFEVARSDKSRPTLFPRGKDPEHAHWRMHDAERQYIGPRQGDFSGSDTELFNAYKKAYSSLDDIKVDVKSPNGTYTLGLDITPIKAVELIEEWLKTQGLLK